MTERAAAVVHSPPTATAPISRPSALGRPSVQVGLVILVCIAVYWVRLGADGFVSTEGHRVLPAWGMLDSGDFLVPRLFGQIYLRKPPGMAWAVAASSALLGRTEFAARAVSALSMTAGALLALAFARRWFGKFDPAAGLVGGLAHALTPWFWQIGRVAEIEALHLLTVQAAVFLLLELMIGEGRRSRSSTIALAGAAGVSMAAMGLVKGPAGAPCIAAALAGACIVSRSARPLLRPAIRGAVLVTALILVAALGAVFAAVARTGGETLSQPVGEFLWARGQSAGVSLLLPTALGSALPLSFWLLYPWGASLDPHAPDANRIAKALALTCLLSLVVYLLFGVNNRRYVLPAFSFLGPLAAFAAWRMASGKVVGLPWPLAHALLIDRLSMWFVALMVGAGVWLAVVEPRRAARSGLPPGLAIAAAIERQDPPGTELWADDLIEARPDVLAYASRELAAAGHPFQVLWKAGAKPPQIPPPGQYLAIRTDGGSNELAMFIACGFADRTELVMSGTVHEFTYNIYRVKPPAGPSALGG